jgi:hypothetical protein
MKISELAASDAPIEAVVLAHKALSSGITQSTDAAVKCLSPSYKYLPHASSVSFGAVEDKALLDLLLREIGRGSAGCFVRSMLGSEQVLCDLDQAWIRRQYAPHLYPMKHAPHGWHQDGALGFDFFTLGDSKLDSEALLPTVTCWIALTWCGVDAPGLEFLSQKVEALLLPEELTDDTINSRFSADLFWKPQMQAGDAVVFSGATLHRTHVSHQMQMNRTSVELRFVAKDNIPQRLSGDCFVPLPQAIECEPNS